MRTCGQVFSIAHLQSVSQRCGLRVQSMAAQHNMAASLHDSPSAAKIAEMIQRKCWPPSNQSLHPLVKEAWKAADRLAGTGILCTPILRSKPLSAAIGRHQLMLKLENQQITGSFKPRGATNRILSLTDEQLNKGITACSSGNFALGLLYACDVLQGSRRWHQPLRPKIFIASNAAASKVQLLRKKGAEVITFGDDVVEAEMEARKVAEAMGAVYCSPYNDLQVAGGAGTIALEILAELSGPGNDLIVFVPVGGGGLVAGIAAVLKSIDSNITVVGCQPAASDVMRASVAAGHIVEQGSQDTLSAGTAGGVEPGAITLEPCERFVDGWVTTSEREIAKAMVAVRQHHNITLEGSAGMAVAAASKYCNKLPDSAAKTCVVICCGGNISPETFAEAEQSAA